MVLLKNGLNFFLLLLLLCTISFGEKKILLVQSYDENYIWSRGINAGVEEALKGQGIKLDTFYMDTRIRTEVEWKIEAGKAVEEYIRQSQPDLVIASDDDAQQYFGQFFTQLPLVFCGVNQNPAVYGYPRENVTGIKEIPFFQEGVEFSKEFFPEISRILFLGDPGSTSQGMMDQASQLTFPGIKKSDQKIVVSYEEWKTSIIEAPKEYDSIFLIAYRTLTAADGSSMPTEKVAEWTVENSKIPVFAVSDYMVEEGIFGGVVNSPFDQAYQAAQIAVAIVNDKKTPAEFPIVQYPTAQRMIHLSTARKYGFDNEKIIQAGFGEILKAEEAEISRMLLTNVQIKIAKEFSSIDETLSKATKDFSLLLDSEQEIRQVLNTLSQTHRGIVEACYIDQNRIMTLIEPAQFQYAEGAYIGNQEHILQLYETKKPVLSQVFRIVEGFLAVILGRPVFNVEGELKGSIMLVLDPSAFLSGIIDPENIDPRELFVMQSDGTMVYDRDTEEIGKNTFTDPLYADFEDLQTLAKKTAENETGEGEYTFYSEGMAKIVHKHVIWETVALHGTQWRIVMTQ